MADPQGTTEEVIDQNDHYVVDPETGDKYTVNGNEALVDALRRGYNLSEEQPNFRGIPVRGTGGVQELSPSEAQRAIITGQGEAVPYGDYVRDQERKVYDNPLVAGTAAAARGATLGLSDLVTSSLDASWGADATRLRQQNPYADIAGEVLGGGASLLATGGAGGLGRLAGRGVVGLGTEAGGLASRVAAGAVAGGVEGAAFSVGKELSDAALQGREVDSAKITQALGHGLLLGGAIGGALPVAGAAASAAKKKLSTLAEEAVNNAIQKATGVAEGGVLGETAREAALRVAAKKQLEATGGSAAALQELLNNPSLRSSADSILATEAPTAIGKAPGTLLSRTEQKAGVDIVRDRAARELETSLQQVDTVSRGVGPNISSIATRAQAEVLAPLEGKVFGSSDLSSLRSRVSDISALKDYRVSYSGLHSISEEVGALAAKASGEEAKGLIKLQGIIQDEIQKGVETASRELGTDLATELRAQSDKLAAAKAVSTALSEGIAKETAGSLSEATSAVRSLFSGSALTQLGASAGAAVGGPAGAAIGTAAGSVANAAFNRIKTLYGDQAVATAIRAMVDGSPARLSAMVDGLIGSSTAKYVGKAVKAVTTPVAATGKAAARGAAASLPNAERMIRERLFGQPAQDTKEPPRKMVPMKDRIRNASAQVEKGGASSQQVTQVRDALLATQGERDLILQEAISLAPPDVAAVLKGQLASSNATTQFLISLIPPSSNQMSSLTPQAEQPRMSKSEVDTLVVSMRVAADPLSVLDSMEKGTLSSTEVNALRATAPDVYGRLVTTVQAQLQSMEEPLPYKEAVQLSTLLGVAGDPSLDPTTMSWLQEAYTPAQPQQQQPVSTAAQPSPTRKNIDYSRSWELIREEA